MSRREQSYFDKLKKANAKSSKLPNLPKIQSRLGSRGGEFDKNKVDKAWSQALKSCQLQKYVERKNATVKPVTKCWKTIRLFVSSTFSDFQFERDLLIKKVFPDLRAWCKERKLHLVEIDLRLVSYHRVSFSISCFLVVVLNQIKLKVENDLSENRFRDLKGSMSRQNTTSPYNKPQIVFLESK